MADDKKKVDEAKGKSFLEKIIDILKNPDTQKSITSLVEITGGGGLSQADKEKMVKDFTENDAKRVAAEKLLLDKLKANDAKIKNNDDLIATSQATVQKLEQRIAELDKKIAGLDEDFGNLQKEGAGLNKEAADLKKKLGMD